MAQPLRLVSNMEVLEVVRARRALHGAFPPEDRDRGMELLFASLEANLSASGSMGLQPQPFVPAAAAAAPAEAGSSEAAVVDEAAIKSFLRDVKALAGVKLLKSELLQIVNLKPRSANVVQLIVPDRGGLLTEEIYEAIAQLVEDRLCA